LVFFNREVCEDSWEKILHNTTFMQNNRAEYLAGAWDEEMLYDFEIEIIRLEDLCGCIPVLIDASVSSRVELHKYFLSILSGILRSPKKRNSTSCTGDQEVPSLLP